MPFQQRWHALINDEGTTGGLIQWTVVVAHSWCTNQPASPDSGLNRATVFLFLHVDSTWAKENMKQPDFLQTRRLWL